MGSIWGVPFFYRTRIFTKKNLWPKRKKNPGFIGKFSDFFEKMDFRYFKSNRSETCFNEFLRYFWNKDFFIGLKIEKQIFDEEVKFWIFGIKGQKSGFFGVRKSWPNKTL